MAFGKRNKTQKYQASPFVVVKHSARRRKGNLSSLVLQRITDIGTVNTFLFLLFVSNTIVFYTVSRRFNGVINPSDKVKMLRDFKKNTGLQQGSIMYHSAIENVLNSEAVNVALKKTAAQSSTFGVDPLDASNLDGSGEGGANNALDGNRLEMISQTGAKDCNPWWQTHLDGSYNINHIIIFKKPDSFQHKMKKFHVEVLKSLEEATAEVFHKSAAGEIIGVEFKPPARGEFVRIRMEECGIIHMLQVEVYGTPLS
eukprot:CAMPEP_0172478534 /NCGR_PEP_ID=MMETSP1066-20121228/2557_1 /TAXON_ID=671091 /ORGANISM="Coscinodiscus wailesii, Strain CCMP2513" /LENGTH=255 /DNA_ID=CAMNT_0013238191 /DNA_START=78 /DNA_END=845 /DNA_ORIENTATION=-